MTEDDKQPTTPEAVVTTEPAVAERPKTVLEEIIAETETLAPKKGKGKVELKTISATEIKPGMVIRVHQKILETNTKGEEKERIQVFQGMVLAHKHGREAGATITVRKVSEGIGVERIYPLNLPTIAKFELVRQFAVRQARPYFLRNYKKKLQEIK